MLYTVKTTNLGAAVLGVCVQIKISPNKGFRLSLAYLAKHQVQAKRKIHAEKIQEMCSDYLICLGFDQIKSNWTAALHSTQNGARNHIHLFVKSGVRSAIL